MSGRSSTPIRFERAVSNALAIAAVTETLVQFLSNHLDAAKVPTAWVTSVTPDQTKNLPNPGINVFLYQVTPNQAFRNADLQTRATDAAGTLLRVPQVALDLHYLLTFHGDDNALEPQRLLGAATIAIHANPNLARNIIQLAPTAPLDQQHQVGQGAPSLLDQQSQLVRLTPITFTLEEMSKLWSFLLKVDYVLSSAYIASVVLIETDDVAPPAAPPALNYQVAVQPFRQPVIASVSAAAGAGQPIVAGSQIVIRGANLAAPPGAATQVMIGGVLQSPQTITPNSIALTLSSGLAAGPCTAQILQPDLLDSPPTLHPGTGATSGVFAFVLAPSIPAGPGSIQKLATTGSPPSSPPGAALAVSVTPTALAGQRVLLLLSQNNPRFTRLIDGGTLAANAETLTFALPALPPGTYLVQVLVDGARSALQAAGGTPIGPTVTL
jgi:hypothetical protein